MLDRPEFVIGISGKMRFPGFDPGPSARGVLGVQERELRERFLAVLDWVRASQEQGHLCLHSGRFESQHDARCPAGPCPAGLGLKETTVVVLSSLAPGVDTLLAELALDRGKADRTGGRTIVRGVLPFPVDVYERSSTFSPSGVDEASKQAHLARYRSLVREIRRQEEFDADRDLFEVEMSPIRAGDPELDLERRDGAGVPYRRYRYRAAGEYVAMRSDLLVAACPPMHGYKGRRFELHDAGTEAIVAAKRRGASDGLLAAPPGIGWADNGPVLHLVLDANGDRAVRPAMELLHPFDLVPHPLVELTRMQRLRRRLGLPVPVRWSRRQDPVATPNGDARWQRDGIELFQSMAEDLESAAALGSAELRSPNREHRLAGQARELDSLLGLHRDPARVDRLRAAPGMQRMLSALEGPARLRRRVADVAGDLDRRRSDLMRRLLLSVFVSALSLGAYEHWVSEPLNTDHPALVVRHPAGWAQVFLLALTLGALLYSALRFQRYRSEGAERRRYDLRALAEGLRVQIHLCLAGLPGPAAAQYMQRQRAELNWIRQAVTGPFEPAGRWVREFRALAQESPGLQADLLRSVHETWVRGQLEFAGGKGLSFRAKQDFWHHWAWGASAVGLVNILLKLLSELSPLVHHELELHPARFAAGLLLPGLALMALAAARPASGHGPSQATTGGLFQWLFRRPLLWGYALILGAGVLYLPHVLGGAGVLLPSWHDWWIILTGAVLLSGALGLAWSERNFHGEHARQYAALEALYEGADRRLTALLRRFEDAIAGSAPDSDREVALREIHELLITLAEEALDENAEWLILHRTRPLEPFLAG
jgi:hypothetical protein